MEATVLLVFCVGLIACVIADTSIVYALLAGLILFLLFGRYKGSSAKELAEMCLKGVKTTKGILITFLLIGILTAMWRLSGCIPTIVCFTSGMIAPGIFLPATFLLNCLVSVLTGTAFGTAATMGVICVSIARSMNMDIFWVGGAVLSGIFFGDRCSPVSTSALLVSTLTETNIYRNIRNMLKTALVPFLLACGIYYAAGRSLPAADAGMDVNVLFREEFAIHIVCLLPAVAIVFLALFRLNVKWLMLVSIAVSVPVAIFKQGANVGDILRAAFTGFQTDSAEMAAMMNGGGIFSMLKVTAIVCIASCYSGLLEKTGLLRFMYGAVEKMGRKLGTYVTTLLVSVPISGLACNQTLGIMLTDQLTRKLENNREQRAVYLENSAVIVAPLIPWSIAGTVPLTSLGAPSTCILTACYLYLLPVVYAAVSLWKHRKTEKT